MENRPVGGPGLQKLRFSAISHRPRALTRRGVGFSKHAPRFGAALCLAIATGFASEAWAQGPAPAYRVVTVAGPAESGPGNEDGLVARFSNPSAVAVDGAGNTWIADTGNHTIRKLAPKGMVSTLAGLAGQPGSTDGLGAAARFNAPQGLAVDQSGTVYVADTANHVIRKVDRGGWVTTWAGLAGTSGSADGVGSASRFSGPCGVALDAAGNLYVADTGNHTIRRIEPSGMVTTVAGSAGVVGHSDGDGSVARFRSPAGIVVDRPGHVLIADTANQTIRRMGLDGRVTTLAGLAGTVGSKDGLGAAARFNYPRGLTVDSGGNVYVADSTNCLIRRVEPDGNVTTVAGQTYPDIRDGYALGDPFGGLWPWALFAYPTAVAANGAGDLYVADRGNHAIRWIGGGWVATVAGLVPVTGNTDGPANLARFNGPAGGVAADPAGRIYVVDWGNDTIRLLAPDGMVSTWISRETFAKAAIGLPTTMTADSLGNLYVADLSDIAKITPQGVVTIFAGGRVGIDLETGNAPSFHEPAGLAADNLGNVYVAEALTSTIRKIGPGGVVTPVAGKAYQPGFSDGTGSAARFRNPQGLATDGAGNLYVADFGNFTIRRVDPAGQVTTLAGKPGSQGAIDGPGTTARFTAPLSLAMDKSNDLYVVDYGAIRRVGLDGQVTTVAGAAGQSGTSDGFVAAARFSVYADYSLSGQTMGIAVAPNGGIYVADIANNCLRLVTAKSCPDAPIIDLAVGPVGAARQLDTWPQTAVTWDWRPIHWPAASQAALSATNIRNPVFTPDVADLYVVQLRVTDAAGGITVSNLTFLAEAPSPGQPRLYAGQTPQHVTLAWSSAERFVLESADTLGSGAVWTTVSGATNNSITLPINSSTNQFFRLRK